MYDSIYIYIEGKQMYDSIYIYMESYICFPSTYTYEFHWNNHVPTHGTHIYSLPCIIYIYINQ